MGDTRDCPVCAETIKAQALKCRFCGADLTIQVPPCKFCGGPMQKETRKQISAGGMVFGILLILVGLLVAFAANIVFGAVLILVGIIIIPSFKSEYKILVCAKCHKARYAGT